MEGGNVMGYALARFGSYCRGAQFRTETVPRLKCFVARVIVYPNVHVLLLGNLLLLAIRARTATSDANSDGDERWRILLKVT